MYLHCQECEWEQDDFWNWKYNPIRSFLGSLKFHIKYRTLTFNILKVEIQILTAKFKYQHWWTSELWGEDDLRWICPKCKARSLCLDKGKAEQYEKI